MLELFKYMTSGFWIFWYSIGIIGFTAVMLAWIVACATPLFSETTHHHHYPKKEEENDRTS